MQLALFRSPLQQRRRESALIYAAVLQLRRKRFRVYRAGSVHLVNGQRLATRRLLALAGIAS